MGNINLNNNHQTIVRNVIYIGIKITIQFILKKKKTTKKTYIDNNNSYIILYRLKGLQLRIDVHR